MKIFIKNMVCERCKMAVRAELEKVGLTAIDVQLGEIEVEQEDIAAQIHVLEKNLNELGFELLSDKKTQLVEQIKGLIIELIHRDDITIQTNLSDYLANALSRDYASLSSVFSELEKYTLEKYFIKQKIERVKELLEYDELSLNEIAFKLHYSSVAHLSAQFKKIAGVSPSHYKKLAHSSRSALDDL